MSPEHEHHDPSLETQDAGSQALAEALRSSFAIVQITMWLLIIAIFASGIFTVGPQEKAVILRFGKPQGEGQKMLLGAGLHFALPYPIDQVVRIPITEIQKVTSTVGWYNTTPEQELAGTEPPPGLSLNPAADGYVVTADRNIIHTRATVSYHIDDPLAALFNFASGTNQSFTLAGVSNAVQNAANNAIISTAARFKVDDILTRNIGGFREAVAERVNDLVEGEHLGVAIDQCEVQSIAPRQLTDVFALVITARQNQDKQRNDALIEANRILSQAGSTANSITNTAEAARTRFVTSVASDATAFSELLPHYQSNPGLYERMELAKAMGDILTNVNDKIYVAQRGDGKTRELRLMLNREPQEQKSATP